MIFEKLKSERVVAMKNGETARARKNALSNMIDAIQKASITNKGRIEITDDLCNQTLIKYQKNLQESIDTCPASYTERKAEYEAEMSVVKEFAPQMITDKEVIKNKASVLICESGLTPDKKNKGAIMKLASAEFKGKADMKIVSQVIAEMLT